jgi:hypothetical protein
MQCNAGKLESMTKTLVSHLRTIFVIMRRGGGRSSVSVVASSIASLSVGVVGASTGVEGSSMGVSFSSAMVCLL